MASFITNTAFIPTIGKCYEVHYGKITINKKTGFYVARIKIEGDKKSEWIDLDTNKSLDPDVANYYTVQAYTEVKCS